MFDGCLVVVWVVYGDCEVFLGCDVVFFVVVAIICVDDMED